jgi:hypothetical protein
MLEERGFKSVADKLLELVDKNRRVLVTAEEAYTMSRYGESSHTSEEGCYVGLGAREFTGGG